MERVILHCDMNNFYASVECKLNPSIRSKYVAVCGNMKERHGIVLAKNQRAKLKGVKTGQPIWEAKLRCPDLIVVHPHFEKYAYYSKKAREIYYRYTDMVEPFGMDECWLDVTASVALFGSGETIADMIRENIKKELGLTISVGVSFNKVFAKLGSDLKKPDAVTVIKRENFRERIWELPVEQLLGVGYSTQKKLRQVGVLTIGQLAQYPREFLLSKFGKNGGSLWDYANGLENSRVMDHEEYAPIKSISHGITTTENLTTDQQVWRVILELSQQIARKLRKEHLSAAGVQLSVKNHLLITTEFQARFPCAQQNALEIARLAYKLFCKRYDWRNHVRALSVRAISLQPDDQPAQLDLFEDISVADRRNKIDRVVDQLRLRYGDTSVRNAVLLQDLKMPKLKQDSMLPPAFSRNH